MYLEHFVGLVMGVETLLHIVLRCRFCFIIKPKQWTGGRTSDTYQKWFRSHVIAFPNLDVQTVSRLLTPISEIPDMMKVVFLTIASDKTDLEKLARSGQLKSLHIRGKEVAKWAVHLSKVRIVRSSGVAIARFVCIPRSASCVAGRVHGLCLFHDMAQQVYGMGPVNSTHLAQYEELDGVPACLLDDAIFARTAEEAKLMSAAFIGDRHGYANNKDMPSEAGEMSGHATCFRYIMMRKGVHCFCERCCAIPVELCSNGGGRNATPGANRQRRGCCWCTCSTCIACG